MASLPRLPDRHPRGGSQLVPYDGGWLAVVHEVIEDDWYRVYTHRFARFDAALTRVELGRPWYIRDLGVEFVAGLAFWRGRAAISFGYRHHEACVAITSEASVRALLP